MSRLQQLSESFQLKFQKFLNGCDAQEELDRWDQDAFGDMDAYYAADMTSIVLRLTVADGRVTPEEVRYIEEMFGFRYTQQEVWDIYRDCQAGIDTVFDTEAENGYSRILAVNEKLGAAYKELVCLICTIIIESDGILEGREVALAEQVRSWGM